MSKVLYKVDYEPTCVDVIVGRTGLAASMVSAILLELELQSLLVKVPADYVRKLG